MKIAAIQMNMRFCEPDGNFKRAGRLIDESMRDFPDVIVLPEMWNTGFFPKDNHKKYCDINGERVKAEIGMLAKQYSVNIIAGSIADMRSGKAFNTSYIFDRSGVCSAVYDKTHLFSQMGEDRYFEKGGKPCIFEIDGVKCAVVICYDIRFPEYIRTLALNGICCLFVVSQWPIVRIPHLLTLTQARAIENQIFLVCCNSCGTNGDIQYGGSSVIYDPTGEVLAKAGKYEKIITADCDLSVLHGIRSNINVYQDRRPDIYSI